MSTIGTHLATFLYALAGGVIPVFNVEAYLLALVALAPQTALVPTVACAASGQMTAKGLLYLAGRGLLRLPGRQGESKAVAALARLAGPPRRANAVVLTSSITGLPSFYGVSLAAGVVRFPLGRFLLVGMLGRVLRFAAIVLLTRQVS